MSRQLRVVIRTWLIVFLIVLVTMAWLAQTGRLAALRQTIPL